MILASVILSATNFLLQEWKSLYKIGHGLFTFFTRQRTVGMYKLLTYDSTLELCDAQGHQALIHRRQKMTFLQDHVVAFQDYVWGGDGNQLVDYQISPGKVANVYPDGDRWTILIALDEVKSKEDIVEFHIERTIIDGFTQDSEWRETEVWQDTEYMRLAIIFPIERPCRKAVLVERSLHKSTLLGPEHFTQEADGRQMLVWEKKQPRKSERYTIRWKW